MIPKYVYRSQIFNEFTSEEQEKYFGLKEKHTCSHIDTLYYSVKLSDDNNDHPRPGMVKLLETLAELKDKAIKRKTEAEKRRKEKKKNPQKQNNDSEEDDKDILFHGLTVVFTGFSIYEFHLSLPELFDIFISSYLPNPDTPRIVVQLRTRSLVLNGPYKAVDDSFDYVLDIVKEFRLTVADVDVNRVDYAYHTNLIQNPMEYFNDKRMRYSLCSTLRKYMKIGTIRDTITLETLSLGTRKSNNIFWRCYDKTAEVIQKNYKSFFFDRWKEQGLISEYDHFVLTYAYEHNSYVAGLHLGRMKWYLKYGHNSDLKAKLRKMIERYHTRSDNNKAFKKELDGYYGFYREEEKELNALLPRVTLIMNIEYQTKRAFYVQIKDFLETVQWNGMAPPELVRKVYAVIAARSAIQKYLTSDTVFWCKYNKKGEKLFDKDGNRIPADWWKLIRSCKVDAEGDFGPLVRKHDLDADLNKTLYRLKNTFAHFQNLKQMSTEERSFDEDISDTLCYLNDNDFCKVVDENGKAVKFKNTGYYELQRRKGRQDKGLIASLERKKQMKYTIIREEFDLVERMINTKPHERK